MPRGHTRRPLSSKSANHVAPIWANHVAPIWAWARFVACFRSAAEKLRVGDRAAPFPAGSFPPALPFVSG